MLQFDLPRTISGAGARFALPDELAALGVARPLLVTDKGIVAAGLLDLIGEALGGLDDVALLDDVTENPVFDDAEEGVTKYVECGCDAVIALGGGSPIDTAKYIALIATNGGRVADYVKGPVDHRRCAPLIVIPTTAGTGSEASPDAGIHPDSVTASVGMRSRHIIPHLAVLDPELTLSLPAHLTAATGIDAISHCVEGFLSVNTSSLTDAMLLEGIDRALENLRILRTDHANIEARGEMQIAAFIGGLGIHMGLGPAHAVAIACGDQGFHHGVLSGIGLVCTLDALEPFVPERMAVLRQAFQVADRASLSDLIKDLMHELDLPASLGEIGYHAGDISQLGELAHSTPFNLTARHHFSPQVFSEMIASSSRTPTG